MVCHEYGTGAPVQRHHAALISGFLLCGWQGALLQLVLIALDMVIYLPFIKALDMQFLKEEEGGEPEVAV